MDKKLYEHEWLTLYERDGWYPFYELKCIDESKVSGVAVLVYNFDNPTEKKILARFESRPPHEYGTCLRDEGKWLTSITGAYDNHLLSHEETACKEVREEAGIRCAPSDLLPLGYCYPTKMSSDRVAMFALDASGKEKVELSSDGTKTDKGAYVRWLPEQEVLRWVNCPMVGLMWSRLLFKIGYSAIKIEN